MSVIRSELWRALASGGMRRETPRNLDALWHRGAGLIKRLGTRTSQFIAMSDQVIALQPATEALGDKALREHATELRARFRAARDTSADLIRAFALIRETAHRTLGMRHYPVQLAGGLAIASGAIAEMATGEGKTLTATLPATIAGWRGRGCHIVTVNDYLAQRDAAWMRPVYEALGVTVGSLAGETPPADRRAAYAADVTYCTNKEVAADFLRDRLRLGDTRSLGSALVRSFGMRGRLDGLMMRGLECAIIDEADSVLIDEAVTPLIIAGEAPNQAQTSAFEQAAIIARDLDQGTHFTIERRYQEVRLTPAGIDRVMQVATPLGGIWAGRRRAEELVVQALTARVLYLRDKHYVVQSDAVVIVDDFTGRLMPDRTWKDGLHQAVEAKEALAVKSPKDTLARVSFQRFFRLYKRLSGMTGTAAEESAELWQIYRLPVVVIPPNKPCRRNELPDRVFDAAAAKWDAAAQEIERIHREGRPVLVGARTVAQSERLSELLAARGVDHQVLSATRHAEEARIIAGAGHAGRVTIATNMAGRGTDIRLEPGVAERGGLHVVSIERHESRRVDRQLFGRAGRQGDPGSTQCFVSLEDELVERFAPIARKKLASSAATGGGEIPSTLASPLFASAQRAAQRLARERRRGVLRADDWLDDALGFAGTGV
jgi:preprotein translocase subunit SecA